MAPLTPLYLFSGYTWGMKVPPGPQVGFCRQWGGVGSWVYPAAPGLVQPERGIPGRWFPPVLSLGPLPLCAQCPPSCKGVGAPLSSL